MKIICLERVIVLALQDAISLEIKFNLSEKGREWEHIGDFLYKNQDISVNIEQFQFITDLLDKNNITYVKIFNQYKGEPNRAPTGEPNCAPTGEPNRATGDVIIMPKRGI